MRQACVSETTNLFHQGRVALSLRTFAFLFTNIHIPHRHHREMELTRNLEPGAGGECTVGLVPSNAGEFNKFRSAAPVSTHCCERRLLVVTVVFACAINTLIALFALALVLNARVEIGRLQFVQTKFHEQKVRDRAEIEQLQAKLKQQKELLGMILDYTTGSGVTDEEVSVADSAKTSLGLGTEEPSPGAGAEQVRLLADGLLTESEEASLNGDGGAVQAGVGADGQRSDNGLKADGREDVPESEGGEAPQSRAIPAVARRKRRSVPVQDCNCNDPNAPPRWLNGCCCKKRANNTELYNKATIERYRAVFGDTSPRRAAGHFVACIPSQQNLNVRQPDGEMVGHNLFRSRTKDVYIGDSEPWSTFESSSAAFTYYPLNSTMIIKQDGLYFIYVNVAHVLYTISTLSVNGVEWLRCQHRPATRDYDLNHSPLTMGRESCNMYGVRPLLAGDKLRIQNGVAQLVAEVVMPHCTNFGIVKL
jgi:hypothetical protein